MEGKYACGGIWCNSECAHTGAAHPLALHTHAHACTRIRGLRQLSPIPRQDPTPLMRLSMPFPPPPPSSTPRPIYAGIAGASVLHAMEIRGEKGGKSGCGGTHPSPFLLCAAQLHYFSFSSPPGQSPAISSTEAFKSFKLGGVWVKNV